MAIAPLPSLVSGQRSMVDMFASLWRSPVAG